MKFRTTIIFGIILVALAGYVYFVEMKGAERREAAEQGSKQVLSMEKEDVIELKLSFSDRTVHCLRDTTERWRLVEPVETEGSKEDINRLLSALASATIRRTLADSVESLSDYGLDRPRGSVSVRQEGEEGWKALLLGDENPTGADVYAKRANEAKVFLVSSSLFGSLDKKLDDLRFKKVLDFDKQDVRKISLLASGRSIVCSKVLDEWRLETPVRAKAAGDEIDALLTKLSGAKAIDFVVEEVQDEVQYGLDKPQVTIDLFVGETDALKRLNIGKRAGEAYYARDISRHHVFTVDSSLVAALSKDVLDLRDKTVLAVRPHAVQRIRMRTPALNLLCGRDSTETWHILEPIRMKADESRINDLLWDLDGLEAEDFVSDSPVALMPYGLSEPEIRIELWVEGDSTVQGLFVGERSGEGVYVKNTASPSVYLVNAGFLEEMGKTVTDFRDKKVIHFFSYQVEEIEIAGKDETSRWKKDSKGVWKISSGRKVAKSDVSGLLSDLQSLEVGEFVEDEPTDLTAYGLVEPQYTITLHLKDKPLQVLLVGREQNGGVYVKNREIDSVYSVVSDLLEKMRHLLRGGDEET